MKLEKEEIKKNWNSRIELNKIELVTQKNKERNEVEKIETFEYLKSLFKINFVENTQTHTYIIEREASERIKKVKSWDSKR